MPPGRKVPFEAILPFAAAGVLFGLLYNALFYPHTLVEYAEAGTIGLILGVAAGILEGTFLGKRLGGWSVRHSLAVRTILYPVFVTVALSLVLAIEPATLGECSYVGCVTRYVSGPLFLRDLTFSVLIIFPLLLVAQVVLLVGTRNVGRLILGRYRRPRELYATFMFVDVRGSTAIAEHLGHERFSAFLRDFFNDVSDGIQEARGEVYQYVGDEVVVVWLGGRAERSAPWLVCYERMRARVSEAAPRYLERYGIEPEFKAGVHGGLVIVTEVGSVHRALVYHGDVLNTASRLEHRCNQAGFDLLVTGPLMERVPAARRSEFERVGEVALRGKAEAVVVYGFDRRGG